ncbi:hypothetical protein E2C01_102141 [Portunus trituberculatus]|uniref:BED-type domain-containing protein n=1 Tax=Portunus trituberculatus TaxID=210409 RepID=A0A5B7KNI8_PORTR|nr:hypothetical protein [Portunus trituberculatus]
MAAKRSRNAPIWNYMEQTKDDSATCLTCKETFKYVGGTTSNLIKYLRIKHPIECAELKEENDARCTGIRVPQRDEYRAAWICQRAASRIPLLGKSSAAPPRDQVLGFGFGSHGSARPSNRIREYIKSRILPSSTGNQIWETPLHYTEGESEKKQSWR